MNKNEVWALITDVAQTARHHGYAIYLLSPEELKGANPRDVEEQIACVAPDIVDSLKSSHWDEDPEYPVADWQADVAEDATRQSYREWVDSQRECYEDPKTPEDTND